MTVLEVKLLCGLGDASLAVQVEGVLSLIHVFQFTVCCAGNRKQGVCHRV